LQACARQQGFEVTVVYANLLFASMVGHGEYQQMLERRIYAEQVFRHVAFPEAGWHASDVEPGLRPGAELALTWLDRIEGIISVIGPVLVGATCSFEQISSSVAVLDRCKRLDPRITTAIGGANCEAEMAEGIGTLTSGIDHIFSGESEVTFPAFIDRVINHEPVHDRILHGRPCRDLDGLPTPEYAEFFDQFDLYLGDQASAKPYAVPYESSRGCWWGEKHHCTFCGLNGTTLTHREKSAERVAHELTFLLETYPVDRVNMVDNIMPHRYFATLLPKLKALPPTVSLFYEQKANLSFRKVEDLKAARITIIQPGIESLNSHVLKCMDKGTTAHQNIALLRYARSLGVTLTWNLLAGFPGDMVEDYEEMADLLPHLAHLQPPDGLGLVRFDRFSPYFDDPQSYGISNIRPKPVYAELFPAGADLDKLAYYFDGDYECGTFERPDLIEDMISTVADWRSRWDLSPKPMLAIVNIVGNHHVLIDTRYGTATPIINPLDENEVATLLGGAPVSRKADLGWALDRHLLVELDGRLQPLATGHPDLIRRFERQRSSPELLPIVALPAGVSRIDEPATSRGGGWR
jgi:ribosomal peptide maturation radical SAM protein 1